MKSKSILLAMAALVLAGAPLTARAQGYPADAAGNVLPLGIAPEAATWEVSAASFANAACGDPSCTDPSCTGLAGDPSCTSGVADCLGRDRRCWDLWGGIEMLVWWTKGSNLPPLIGSNTDPAVPQNQASVITSPSYITLFGDGISGQDAQIGGRVTFGTWLDSTHNVGAGLRFFALEGAVDQFDVSSTGNPIVGRPFFNVQLLPAPGQEDALLVAYPGLVEGDAHGSYKNNLLGAEGFLRVMMQRSQLRRVDLIAGYQFMRLDDQLEVRSFHTVVDPASIINGFTFDVRDRFRSINQFHGGTLGLQGSMSRGNWSLNGLFKVGVGNNHQSVLVQGTTLVALPPGPPVARNGGLLAMPSNGSGGPAFVRDRLCVIPEFTTSLNYHITPTVNLSVGYNLIWLSNVVVSGDQIDRRVNRSQIPGPVVGPNVPAFPFNDSTYWVQGINLGMNWNF